ncbi:hypothetical protein ABR738_00400 [Streptomyces sp. Edi4]|uniref:hypothetical protein n=1 Tax=Streptomyces sp. Edi4 TaxID=3162527 RepID=UPI003305DE55
MASVVPHRTSRSAQGAASGEDLPQPEPGGVLRLVASGMTLAANGVADGTQLSVVEQPRTVSPTLECARAIRQSRTADIGGLIERMRNTAPAARPGF